MSDLRVSLGALARALECRVIDGALALDAWLGFVALHGGQSEVDQLGDTRVGNQDIGPLDVAVSHSPLERILQPARHSQHERHGLLQTGSGCAAS